MLVLGFDMTDSLLVVCWWSGFRLGFGTGGFARVGGSISALWAPLGRADRELVY